jgi:hypothetical protein
LDYKIYWFSDMCRLISILGLIVLSQQSSSQTLDLFEDSASMVVGPSQNPTTSGNPAPLTLRSLSRFGDRLKATLVDTSSEIINLEWVAGDMPVVPRHEAYQVLETNNGKLRLKLDQSVNCRADASKGQACLPGPILELSLSLAPALKSSSPHKDDNTVVFNTSGPLDINPFEAALANEPEMTEEQRQERLERARIRAERLRQIEPARIADEEIPPGMRVVRTPFGDRLVPETD